MSQIRLVFQRYPLLRGMATYSLLYPASNTAQQLILGDGEIDWTQVARFSVFGTLWVAPTLYTWIRIAGKLFPASTLKDSVKKAVIEQFTYSPFAITTFYTGMTILEGKNFQTAVGELQEKFFPTWKKAAVVWTVIQTGNFTFVPEKNRVPVVSIASFFWVIFLSYMKHKRLKEDKQ